MSTTSTTAQSIFIAAGTYNEQVTIPELASALTVYGYTEDTSSYTDNVVIITYNLSLLDVDSDEATATVINKAEKTAFYNVDIKNSYGKGSQAIALAAYNTQQGYYGVGLYGYQDTLLAETGSQFYGVCYIEGAVDFIFGQEAIAWIDGSTIALAAASGGAITASGRATSTSDSYYVINKSTVEAASGVSITTGTIFLGRPWAVDARVAFQNTALSSIIATAGWEVWSTTDTDTSGVTFAEYGNTGDGAEGTRASFATTLDAALEIATILGSDYAGWVDTTYVS